MRVLHVISGLFYGGGHRSTLNLVEALPQVADVDVTFCTLGEPAEASLAKRCDFVVPFNGRYNDPQVLYHTARHLARHLKHTDFDIVHTHGLDADLIGAIAVRRKSRHVCHLRITPPREKRESWKAHVRRRFLRFMTTRSDSWYIAVSEAVRTEMASYYGFRLDRIVTVRNGINLDTFLSDSQNRNGRTADSLIIGTAGRLSPMKGFEHLIDAAGDLASRHVDFELRIAGSGSLLSELQQKAQSCGIADRVTFCGHLSDMSRFYKELDIFVLPSVSTEGLPLTVLEAMAAQLPVIATSVGGTAEALRDGIDGIVVPPGDSRRLSSALAQLAGSPDLCKQMGQSGRNRVKTDFSRDRVAAEVYEVYCQMLGASHVAQTAHEIRWRS